jgi:hypothetical protein
MKTHYHYTVPCGLLLLGICLFIRYQIGRRRFYRRGIGGLQHFSSYRKAVIISLLERLVLFIGNLCALAGLFLLALCRFHSL